MKRILLVLAIALASLFATSCVQEHLEAQFIPGNVTVQGLGQITGCALSEDGSPLTTTYSAVDFGLSVPVSYTLWMDISGSNFANAKKVDATIANGQISFAQKKFNKTLLNMGITPEAEVSVDFMLDAYMQTEKGSNIEKYVQHSNVVTAVFTVYEEAKGDLPVVDVPGDYQGWAPSDYPKLFSYSYDEIIYRGVIDFQCKNESGSAANGFKITGSGNWDNDSGNWGVLAGSAPASEAGVVYLENGSGDNILCYGANRYYLFEFNKDALTLTKLMSFDKVGVIGLNGDWDNDVVMTYNMYKGRFWADVDLAADTEFKFRLDGAWDNNWGGDLEDLKGGADNIPIPAGQHRIYFYMNDVTLYAEINDEMFGQEEPGLDEPEPEPVTYEGWGLIGDFNEWSADVEMTEKDGVWTGYINVTADQGWKLRKDAGWDENVGGVFTALDTPFEAVAGGENIVIGKDGFFKVVYDTNAGTITVSDGTIWGVIGDFNSWGGDIFMTEDDGVWTSPAITLEAGKGFKIRKNAAWDENRGAEGEEEPYEVTPGTAFTVVNNGKNLTVPATGEYIVVYNANEETITVNQALPSNTWSLIGVNGDWDNDIFMSEVIPGVWVSPATAMSGEFKLRFNHDWAVNRGCAPLALGGAAQAATQDGKNIGIAEGTYVVVFDANMELIYLQGWSLIGTLNGTNWDTDFPVLPMDVDDNDIAWISYPFQVDETQEFKFRYNAGWDINKGGDFTDFCIPFPAVDNGKNVKIGQAGYYYAAYNPATEELGVGRADWSLIGDFNAWSGDVVLYEGEPGIYSLLSPVFLKKGEGFKLRKDRDWGTNRGDAGDVEPAEVAIATEIPVVNNGKNFTVPADGGYIVTYDSVKDIVIVIAVE